MSVTSTRHDDRADTFAVALRAAINDRGLSLDRVRHHLRQRGHELSAATLSYWQSGRSRPDRATSLAALGSLEEILQVPRGSLTALLPARVRKPSAAAIETSNVGSMFEAGSFIDQSVRRLGASWDDLEPIAVHDLITVNANRTVASHRIRETLRATRNGVVCLPAFYGESDPHVTPNIMARRNCRLGQVIEHPDEGLIVAELLLDRPLASGDVVLVEYEYALAGPPPISDGWERGCLHRQRELLVEVVFTEPVLPAAVRARIVQGEDDRSAPVSLNGNLLSLLRLDFGPGLLGLYWTW